jgi:hypothetical protein
MQSGQVIYRGETGTYYGYDYDAIPTNVDEQIRSLDLQLQQKELIYLGRLSCSQFEQIQIYTYATVDQRTSISLMAGFSGGLAGIDCVSKFSDGSYLTSTTSRVVQNAYQKQGLYRNSYPQLDALALLTQHQADLKDFQMRCGATQKVFRTLANVAQMVDDYTLRQRTNSGNFFWRWIGAFKILLGV